MNSEFIKKLGVVGNQELVITRYDSSELSKDENGDVSVLIRGLVLSPFDSLNSIVEKIYCDSATVFFKKDAV